MVPKKINLMPKKFNLVAKKFNLVPKKNQNSDGKSILLLKKISLVPKNLKIVSKKELSNGVNGLCSSMSVCNVAIICAAITLEVTWSQGDLPLSSWRHCKKEYLSFSVLKLVFV